MLRRILLALLTLLLCTPFAYAQWPFVPIVQSESGGANATPGTCPFDRNVTGGNIELVGIAWEATTNTPTVTDTLLSTYTQRFINTANTVKMAVYTTTFGSSGANTVSAAITGASFIHVNCIELPPLWTLTVDTSASATYAASPATVTSPSITPTLNSDLVYVWNGNDNTAGFQGLQTGSFNTWYQVGSLGGAASGGPADSSSGFINVSAPSGVGLSVTLDNGGTLGTLVSIAFQSKPIAINSTANAPDGATSTTYNFTAFASGGAGAYTWSVVSGALPTGLLLTAATGAITGTPIVAGFFTPTLQVTDGTHTTTKPISFHIVSSLPTISFVQGNSITVISPGGAATLAFSGNVTAGDAILTSSNYNGVRAQAGYCTDTLGTVFTPIADWPSKANSTQQSAIFTEQHSVGIAPASGADTVTCGSAFLGSSLGLLVAIAEYSGVTYAANDNTLGTRGTAASPATITSGSLTTLMPNELLFGSCSANTTTGLNTVDAPFSVVGTNGTNPSTGYRVVTTVAGYTMSCDQASNTNTNWLMGLVGLRPGIAATSRRIKRQVY